MLWLQARMQLSPSLLEGLQVQVEPLVLLLLWSAKGQPLPKMVVVEPDGLT